MLINLRINESPDRAHVLRTTAHFLSSAVHPSFTAARVIASDRRYSHARFLPIGKGATTCNSTNRAPVARASAIALLMTRSPTGEKSIGARTVSWDRTWEGSVVRRC
jgi:hypothetical protein